MMISPVPMTAILRQRAMFWQVSFPCCDKLFTNQTRAVRHLVHVHGYEVGQAQAHCQAQAQAVRLQRSAR